MIIDKGPTHKDGPDTEHQFFHCTRNQNRVLWIMLHHLRRAVTQEDVQDEGVRIWGGGKTSYQSRMLELEAKGYVVKVGKTFTKSGVTKANTYAMTEEGRAHAVTLRTDHPHIMAG